MNSIQKSPHENLPRQNRLQSSKRHLVQTNQSITQLQHRLWHHISPCRRGQFGLLLVLMLLASFAEILSSGAVLPFLGGREVC